MPISQSRCTAPARSLGALYQTFDPFENTSWSSLVLFVGAYSSRHLVPSTMQNAGFYNSLFDSVWWSESFIHDP